MIRKILLAVLLALAGWPAATPAQTIAARAATLGPRVFVDSFPGQAATVLNPAITYARAGSGAGYLGSDSTWHATATNVARLDAANGLLVEQASTNLIRNNSGAGGSAGVAPTNWPTPSTGAGSLTAGLTFAWLAPGTESGLDYVSFRISGTTSASGSTFVNVESATGITTVQGETISFSAFVKVQAGDLTGISSLKLNMTERTSGGGTLASSAGSAFVPTGAALGTQRQAFTAAMVNASTARVQPNILLTHPTGTAVDVTLRIHVQTERAAFATSPIRTSSAAVTRAADAATQRSVWSLVSALPGSVALSAITAPGAGTQVLWEQNDGTESNRLRIYRNSAGVIHAVSTVAGVDTVDISLGTVANATGFAVTFSWGGTQYSASLNVTTVVNTTGTAAPAGMSTIYLGADTTGNQWNGWITSTRMVAAYQPASTPSWVDTGATFSLDLANGRYYNATPSMLAVTRTTNTTGYDATGARVTFASGVPALPTYNPNAGNAALGLSVYQFSSQWWTNSAAPATQTVTPATAGTYVATCETGSVGSFAMTGGVTQTVTCSDATKGYLGETATPFTLDGATSVTATKSGSASFMQLSNIGFPTPLIVTTGTVPSTRNTDVVRLDLSARPDLLNPMQGTIVTRFFASQIVQAGTMLSVTDGTSNNRLAMNYKISPATFSGLTVVANSGVTSGAADPDVPYLITVGYHTFAGSWTINADYSGTISVSLDGSPVVIGNFAAGKMPTNLGELLFGIDRISGAFAQTLNGSIQRVTGWPVAVANAALPTLSAATGPSPLRRPSNDNRRGETSRLRPTRRFRARMAA